MNFTAKKPWMVKGSAAAKARMKTLRAKQGKKKKSSKSRSGSTASSGKGGGSVTRKPKLPSASKAAILGGGAMVATGIGLDQWAAIQGRANTMLDEVGIGMSVTGGTIVVVLVGAKIVSSFNNWFGRKWRAFLRGYGLRP